MGSPKQVKPLIRNFDGEAKLQNEPVRELTGNEKCRGIRWAERMSNGDKEILKETLMMLGLIEDPLAVGYSDRQKLAKNRKKRRKSA